MAGARPNASQVDGTPIELDRDDIVVLVGPNNSGKSRALRELEVLLGRAVSMTVIVDSTVRQIGSSESFRRDIAKNSLRKGTADAEQFNGYRYSLSVRNLDHFWKNDRRQIVPYFCTRILTETRITDSNPPQNIALLESPPQHPIHILQNDDRIEGRVSDFFSRAFQEDLIVYHGAGNQVPLFVGQRPKKRRGEDRISATYLERLRSTCTPLHEQGDGMRSFVSVVLNIVALERRSVVLLDEPEAFLHPPQARLIGEFIAAERLRNSQLFIATHSADVLKGLLSEDSGRLRIIRIQRKENVNHVKELDKSKTTAIAKDPLLAYSSVFDAIFYQHVFICESDADCLFYSSLSALPQVRRDLSVDATFIHGNGKHRIASLVEALRALDVPVSVIVDIDILNEESVMERLTSVLGGDWNAIKADWAALKKAIEQHKPWLNVTEIATEIRRCLEELPPSGEFPRERRQSIERVFRKASPWDVIKQGGESTIPRGQANQQFKRVLEACSSLGIWIVPSGELEGFCRSVPGHGPAWVQRVLETKSLAKDGELSAARDFLRRAWTKAAS